MTESSPKRTEIEVKPSGVKLPNSQPPKEGDDQSTSKPPVETPQVPAKTVTFKYTEKHQWEVDVSLNDPTFPFTERDWNLIERQLTVQRVMLKRQANLAYHAAMRKKNPSSTTSELTKS